MKPTHQHTENKNVDGRYYCTCHLCDSDYEDDDYDSEYDSYYDEYSSYSEDDISDSEYIDEEVWYDSDFNINEAIYNNVRPHSGWDSTTIPRNRYHLPESVLQNNENVNFYVNNINHNNNNNNNQPTNPTNTTVRSDNLLEQPPARPLLDSANHSRQTTASSSATLVNAGEENSTDDNRTSKNIPNRHANHQPVTENNTNNSNPNNNDSNPNPMNGHHHRRHGLRHRHSSQPNLSNNYHRQNQSGNSSNNRNNDSSDEDFGDDESDHPAFPSRSGINRNGNRPRRSKRKTFFSHLMFVIALISTLALVLFVQVFGYILTAADQARGVTLRLTNYNRQQTVCDNNERTSAENESEEGPRSTENTSSSIPNAEPEVLFTEENPHMAARQNNEANEDHKEEEETEEETEDEKEEEKKKKANKEKNDFLAHLASLRAAQAMADQANQNHPNRVNDPTRLNDPTRHRNPSDRISSYLSNYVYYNSDIYSK